MHTITCIPLLFLKPLQTTLYKLCIYPEKRTTPLRYITPLQTTFYELSFFTIYKYLYLIKDPPLLIGGGSNLCAKNALIYLG